MNISGIYPVSQFRINQFVIIWEYLEEKYPMWSIFYKFTMYILFWQLYFTKILSIRKEILNIFIGYLSIDKILTITSIMIWYLQYNCVTEVVSSQWCKWSINSVRFNPTLNQISVLVNDLWHIHFSIIHFLTVWLIYWLILPEWLTLNNKKIKSAVLFQERYYDFTSNGLNGWQQVVKVK